VVVLAGLVYLVAAVGLWWHVWTGHPATTATCGCGDAARFMWFFEWPVYAIAHGHSLFYSQWLFHPTGINLLDDTSVLALGVGLGPVTALFGPVAAMNVGLTLAPALSALTTFVLLRRWVRWQPAAFVGGLLYGFSPFVVTELALNQLNIAFLAVPPLIVLTLDELLVRQRRSPIRTGVVLGLLVVVQFFLSTEVLVITALFAALGVLLLVAGTAIRDPDALRQRTAAALRGLAVAAGLAVVVLAYPLWFLLRGPGHLTGPIWSNGTSFSEYGTTLSSFVRPGGLGQVHTLSLRFGGYQGPLLPGLGYLGVGAVVVAVVGWVIWRHDRRLLLFGTLGLVAAVLSLQPGRGHWVPWAAIDKLPWIGNIVEARFTLVTSLCIAVMVGLVADHARVAAANRWPALRPRGVAAGALLLVSLLPSIVVLWPNLPLTTRPVTLPPWFTVVGARLPPGNVVLAYPVPFSGLQSSQAWQAVNRMQWAQAGGGGPTGQPGRAGRARPGFEVLSAASLTLGTAPAPTPANLAAVRHALDDWGVTLVVLPVQRDLPGYEQGRSTGYAVAFLTAAVGAAPRFQLGSWVWKWPPTAAGGPGGSIDLSAFDLCLGATGRTDRTSQTIGCVLAHLHQVI
jgi:hypothetical protein